MKMIFNKMMVATVVLAGLAFTSCSEDFLDREPVGDYITEDQLSENMKWNAQVLLGELNGVTSNLIRWQTGGTTRQDDFGQKSVDIVHDLMTGDMVYCNGNSYGWFGEDCRLQNATYNQNRPYILWRYYYRVINAANFNLDTAGSDIVEPENAQNKYYFAVAKTIRAYAYFNLVTNFAKNYNVSKDKKTLPVYRTQTEAYGAPQTVDSVYNFIFEDLNGAIAAYQNAAAEGVTGDISMPGLDVAYTIAAYAYLQKGDNAKALEAATNALTVTSKQPLTGNNLYFGFNTVNNSNWMWGIDITDQNTGGLCTFWGMMDLFTYSYTAAGDFKVINSDLHSQIPDTDARKVWFAITLKNNQGQVVAAGVPGNKFYDPARIMMGDATWTNDIHFMRAEEPYMIAAEAAARMGQLDEAKGYLGVILEDRDAAKAATLEDMTKDELLEEIYFNWRVEFWGEGKSLLTLKRFEKSATRPANDYYVEIGTVNYDDVRFTFAIPQTELQNNPNMKDAEQ